MTKGASVANILKKLLMALAVDRRILLFGMLALTGGSLINLGLPQVLGYLISSEGIRATSENLLTVLAGITLLFVVQAFCFYYRSYYFGLTAHRFVKRCRDAAFRCLLAKPLSYFADHSTGDLSARLSGDLAVMQDMIAFKMSVLIRYSLQVLIAGLLMFSISFQLTFALLLVLPILVLTGIVFGRRLKFLSTTVQNFSGTVIALAQDALQDLKTIKVFAATRFIQEKFEEQTQRTLESGERRAKFSAFFQSFVNLLMNLALVLLLLYGLFLVSTSDLSMANLITFVMYGGIVAVSFAMAASSYAELMQASGAAERVFEVCEINDAASKAELHSHQPEQITVRLDHLCFSYNVDGSQPIIKDLSLELVPGKPVAIVGSSGAGKSTIVKLVLGLYPPTAGKILLNGTELQGEYPEAFYKRTALVAQEPLVFNLSIKDNLLLANTSATEVEMWSALDAVNLSEFVQSLPEKLNSNCGERGSLLSAGQKQRLALARAIIKDPLLLVLDEANSALDSNNEMMINVALLKFFQTRSVLIISHRLASLTFCEQILVIDQGRVVQSGSHNELLETEGPYREMAKLQNLGI
jgi:ABC-type multidrug transport system fused ATPase/permease subunit